MLHLREPTQQLPPSAPSLRIQQGGIEFQSMWHQARFGCEQILNWPSSKHLRGKEMVKHIVELYTMIYRLASNPCRNVPGLVKNGIETVAGKDDQSTQVLVLYYLLREMIKSHLDGRIKPQFAGKSGMEILKTYDELWGQFSIGLELLSIVFRYLHNHWNKQGLPVGHVTTSTKSVGQTLWGEVIVMSLRGPLENELLACIRQDRDTHGSVDPKSAQLIRNVIGTFTILAINEPRRSATFADVFENPYARDTQQFYVAAAAASLQQNDMRLYVRDAQQWTRDESKRVEKYASEKSTIPNNIRRTMLFVLVESRVDHLLAPVDELFQANGEAASEQLGELYQLIKPSDSTVQKLADCVLPRVKTDGLKLIANLAPRENQSVEFIGVVLDIYRRYKKIIVQQFESNVSLMAALRLGCKHFVNQNPQHKSELCAEHLARYANSILKPSQSKEEDIEQLIKEIVDIFDFFDDRDVFQSTYSGLLCQRLIQGNMREAWEERAISAFRLECGRDFTYKWERMLADATTSRIELKSRYNAETENSPSKETMPLVELNPLILTSAWWPLKPDSAPFVSRSVIGDLQRHFEGFYKRTMGGRSLKWLLQFSNGVVEARISATPTVTTFTVSAFQWELLNLFNDASRPSVSFAQFKNTTMSPDTAALQRAAFAFLKQRVLLLTDPAERDVEKQSYCLNTEYVPSQRRINFLLLSQAAAETTHRSVSSASGAPTHPEGVNSGLVGTTHQIHNERRFAIQAAIVRVMKSRRTATYSELFGEVETILRKNKFVVSPQDLKVNLEILIEKEFVERSPTDPNTFVYLT